MCGAHLGGSDMARTWSYFSEVFFLDLRFSPHCRTADDLQNLAGKGMGGLRNEPEGLPLAGSPISVGVT